MSNLENLKVCFHRLSVTRLLLFGYCSVILLGTIFLSLPAAVRDPSDASIFTAFFTSASAACVTGLVLEDTWSHWSLFGQTVILGLIQTGGLGFMTVCISAVSVTHHKIGLSSRIIMQNSISAPHTGGIVRMTRFVFIGTLAAEAVGALLLSLRFIPQMGVAGGIWYAVFHSISAFCNAGFDLMGRTEAFSSLTSMADDPLVNTVIMVLIITGGLGFLVWADLFHCRFHFKRLSFHSKIVLSVTFLLILSGGILLFLLEKDSDSMRNLPLCQKWLSAFFQSVTARTAGFNTLNLTAMTEAGLFVIILLMLIGGSPGSTAGGIKTTTFAVLVLSIVTTCKNRRTTEAFGRRLEEGVTRTASCVLMSYLALTCTAAVVISHLENLPILVTLFESVSAIATVGLTCGITPELSRISAFLLAVLMIFGRVGSLTMLRAIWSSRGFIGSEMPAEKIQIG